tara:strand:- start:60 stop:314 length:255 start_codon:yes stop_codon:yes gene_type:complete
MILIEKAENLNFTFGFNQTQDFILDGLEKAFVEKYGRDLLSKASLVIIIENENFYHVVRDKYYTRISGEFIDNLCGDVLKNLKI